MCRLEHYSKTPDQGKQNHQTPKLNGILINGIVENTSVRIFGKN